MKSRKAPKTATNRLQLHANQVPVTCKSRLTCAHGVPVMTQSSPRRITKEFRRSGGKHVSKSLKTRKTATNRLQMLPNQLPVNCQSRANMCPGCLGHVCVESASNSEGVPTQWRQTRENLCPHETPHSRRCIGAARVPGCPGHVRSCPHTVGWSGSHVKSAHFVGQSLT